MSFLYHAIFFNPLYNILVLLFKVLPWADAGVVVILLTIIVRLILYPLSRKAVLTQVKMNDIAPELQAIKEKYKNQEEQAQKTLELYREKGVNPFSGILVLLIQIPIIFALYRIFYTLPKVDISLLYPFINAPSHISTTFLNIVDLSGRSLVIAVLAAVTTYFQLHISSAKPQQANTKQGDSFSDNLTKSMQGQMKYLFPVMMFFIAYKVSGVIALYFVTTNLFTVAQEIFVRKNLKAARS